MKRSPVLLRVCALGLGVAVALAPMTAASAKTKSKSPTGINRNSAFCKDLISQASASDKYETKLETAFESGNLNSAKTAVLSEFNFATRYVSQALATGQIPGNVQSALRYIVTLYTHEKTAIQNAKSIAALETALTSLTKAPKFTSESQTLDSYVSTQCGSLTTTSTT